MEKHDYRGAHAAMEALFNGHTVKSSGEYRDATLAALRAAVTRQEAEEAVERGEAIRATLHGAFEEYTSMQGRGFSYRACAEPGDFTLSAIVPIPRPVEIEADVES